MKDKPDLTPLFLIAMAILFFGSHFLAWFYGP
jgi:hypothetical protein